jgi:hypothetical protein
LEVEVEGWNGLVAREMSMGREFTGLTTGGGGKLARRMARIVLLRAFS